MIEEIHRKYLQIKSIKKLNEVKKPSNNFVVNQVFSENFQLNKFLYKQIGKKYHWIDRLNWSNQEWINFVSKKNILTFVLKNQSEIAGFYELILDEEKKEVEISYFGIFEEYFGKRLGGFLLSEAIKKSFHLGAKKIFVHTCSLDHKNALNNYISRGMEIYKSEILKIKCA
tara:strand:- start:43 stop:555 length:513 start_codon:yes stop_codon:yes gene_type:complete